MRSVIIDRKSHSFRILGLNKIKNFVWFLRLFKNLKECRNGSYLENDSISAFADFLDFEKIFDFCHFGKRIVWPRIHHDYFLAKNRSQIHKNFIRENETWKTFCCFSRSFQNWGRCENQSRVKPNSKLFFVNYLIL